MHPAEVLSAKFASISAIIALYSVNSASVFLRRLPFFLLSFAA